MMTAERLMLIGGIASFVLTLSWVRNRDLREKYAVGWMALAFFLLLLGLFPELIMKFAESARLGYASAVLFLSLGIIYMFSFFLSVALTRQYRTQVRLTQEVAILEEKLRQLEAQIQKQPQRGASC
jgi:hypothetical protein